MLGNMHSRKIRKVRRIHLPLGFKRQMVISLRRFRTSPSRRSRRFKQYVFSLRLLTYREVAIAFKRQRTTRKQQQVFRLASPSKLLYRAAPPILLSTLSLAGLVYSVHHLQQPPRLDLITHNSTLSVATNKSRRPTVTPKKVKTLPSSQPLHMNIPSINVDAAIENVGQNASGSIQTPSDFWDAGWYDRSPTPGELGPAIIVGHVDSPKNIAIFWRLRELVPGNHIAIKRADGSTADFVVTELKQFPQDNFPTKEVYGNLDYAGIRIITCGGTFNVNTGHYTDNTVVYGRLYA